MSNKPIFVATHPRACSTAFERVFMTRRDTLKCVHEPFGDAWYFGPERLAGRYAEDEDERKASGFEKSTYQVIMERINLDNTEGKRLLIKDMAQYFFPQSHPTVSIAPSLLEQKRGVGTAESVNGDDRKSSIASSNGDFGVVDSDMTSPPNGLQVPATNGISTSPPNGYASSSQNDVVQGAEGITERRTSRNDRRPSFIDPAHFKTKANYRHTRDHSGPAASFAPYKTFTEHENPTVVPTALLKQFHYAFLIRHPRYSIPSYYRCCIPPLEDMTGFHQFRPDEAGYEELRSFFDYCRSAGHIGPDIAGTEKKAVNGHVNGATNGHTNGATNGHTNGHIKPSDEILLIDADDLLDNPEPIMRAFCHSVGIDWTPEMLKWNTDEDHDFATEAFEKWKGFHEDAINSTDLKARGEHRVKTDDELYEDWVGKYGREGADVIKQTVADNLEHYNYLKQFCLKI